MLGQKSELEIEKFLINRDHKGTEYPDESDSSLSSENFKITPHYNNDYANNNSNNNNNTVTEALKTVG